MRVQWIGPLADEEAEDCQTCHGLGENEYSGAVCPDCHGTGEQLVRSASHASHLR